MKTIPKLLRLILISLTFLSAAYLSLPLWLSSLSNAIISSIIDRQDSLELDGIHISYHGIFIERISFSSPDHKLLCLDTRIQSILSENPRLQCGSLSGSLGPGTASDDSPKTESIRIPLSKGSLSIANLSLQIQDELQLTGSLSASLSNSSLFINTDLKTDSSGKQSTLPNLHLQGSLQLSDTFSKLSAADLSLTSEPFEFSIPHYRCSLHRSSAHLDLNHEQTLSGTARFQCKDAEGRIQELLLSCTTQDSLVLCSLQENNHPSLRVEIQAPNFKDSWDLWTIKKISMSNAEALSAALSHYTELPIVLSSLEIEPHASISALQKTISIPAFTIRVSGQYNHIYVRDLSLSYQLESTGPLLTPLTLDLTHLPTTLTAKSIDVVTNTSSCLFSDISGSTQSLIPLIASLEGKNRCSFSAIKLPETNFYCNTESQDVMNCMNKDSKHASLHYEFSVPFESLTPKYVVLKRAHTEDAAVLQNALQAFVPTATLSHGSMSASGSFNLFNNALSTILEFQKLTGIIQEVQLRDASARIPLSFNDKGFQISNGSISMNSIEAGVPLSSLSGILKVHSKPQLYCSISNIHATLFKGSLYIPSLYCDHRLRNQSFDTRLTDVNLESLTTWLNTSTFLARGVLSGTFPINIDKGTLNISDGTFSLGEAGGFLSILLGESYDSVMIPGFEFSVRTMLASLQLKELMAKVSYKQSVLDSTITLLGSNPQVRNGYPLKLTVTLSQNLKALLKTLSISKVFRKRMAGD